MSQQRRVAILIFDDVEVMDFAGPYEVFAMTGQDDSRPFSVSTVSSDGQQISARNGLKVVPDYSFETLPEPDVIVVPGGRGTRPLLNNKDVIDWIRLQSGRVEHLLSVCTGALLLAKAGVLAGLEATTYHTTFDMLQTLEPTVTACPGERWVDNGRIVTSAGVSAGIDMSLYVVGQLLSQTVADETARYMEYTHWPSSQSYRVAGAD